MGAGISSGTHESPKILPIPAAMPSPPITIRPTVVAVDPRTVIIGPTPPPAPIAIRAIGIAVDARTVIIRPTPSPAPIAIRAIVVAIDSRTVITAAPSPMPPACFFDKSVSLPGNGLFG
jgi:hypothetical protein